MEALIGLAILDRAQRMPFNVSCALEAGVQVDHVHLPYSHYPEDYPAEEFFERAGLEGKLLYEEGGISVDRPNGVLWPVESVLKAPWIDFRVTATPVVKKNNPPWFIDSDFIYVNMIMKGKSWASVDIPGLQQFIDSLQAFKRIDDETFSIDPNGELLINRMTPILSVKIPFTSYYFSLPRW